MKGTDATGRTAIRGRASRAIGYSTAFGVVSLVSSIALLPVIFYSVGVGPYGSWLFLITLVQYFYYADFGVGSAVLHFVSRARGGDESKSLDSLISTAIGWAAIAAAVCVPVYIVVANAYLSRDTVAAVLPQGSHWMLIAISASALAVLALRPFGTALIGVGGFVVERKFQFLGLFVRIVGTLAACIGAGSLVGVAIAEALALIVPIVAATVYVLSRNLMKLHFTAASRTMWREMTSYSLRSTASTLASLAAVQGGTIVVGLVGSPVDVSAYNAALRVFMGIKNIGQWCTAPLQTAMSKSYVSSVGKAHAVVRSATFGTLLLVSGVSVAVLVVSDTLVQVWLGPDVPVGEIVTTLDILLVALIVSSLHGPLSMASAAAGRPGLFFPIQCGWAVVGAVLGYILGQEMGIVGVAIGMALPLVVIEPLHFYVAIRYLGLEFSTWWRKCFMPVLLIVGLAGVSASGSRVLVSGSALSDGVPGLILSMSALGLTAFVVSVSLRRYIPWRDFKDALGVEV